MPTYSNLLAHIVFSTKNSTHSLHKSMRPELFKYITGIIRNENANLLAINGVENHIHILIAYKPMQPISELVKKIKSNSSRWIRKNLRGMDLFAWQNGYGVFSVSQSGIPDVIEYINMQEKHHQKISFKDEIEIFLRKHNIPSNG